MSVKIIQSEYDKREFRHIVLPNQLACLLVSDPEADKSGAALDVKIGNLCDPDATQGLAHFLEHMLFLGTSKYPSQDEYRNYLSTNSGDSNASTSTEHTQYHFTVSNAGFYGALDRFSQFFLEPLFTETLAQREMQAVDSEYRKNINDDGRRTYQLTRATAKSGNVYSRFGTGALDTLKKDGIRDELIKFHEKFYSANLMKLCLYGKESLDTLEKWANEFFSTIKNNGITQPTFVDLPYDETNMGNIWKVVPIRDKERLELWWILPNTREHFRNDPCDYISHLIGHEGPNSILSMLVDEGLAYELGSSSHVEMSLFTKFNISIELTHEGMKRYHEVLAIVFSYIKMLQKTPPQQWIFDEMKQTSYLKFLFRDRGSPEGESTKFSRRLNIYPPEYVLSVGDLHEEFKPELITKFLDAMKLDNMRIMLYSKNFEGHTHHEEKWYGTKYSFQPFSDKIKEIWANPEFKPRAGSTKALSLPPPNKYIPKNLAVLAQDVANLPKYPSKIFESDESVLFFKQDNTFKKPKAYCKFLVYSAGVFHEPLRDRLYTTIWEEVFSSFHVREYQYMVRLALVNLGVQGLTRGLEISITGFNDSMLAVVEGFLLQLASFAPEEGAFHLAIERITRQYTNALRGQPYSQTFAYQRRYMLTTGQYLPQEYLAELKKVNYKDFLHFSQNWLTQTRIDALVVGNIDRPTAQLLLTTLERGLLKIRQSPQILRKDQAIEIRPIELPEKSQQLVQFDLSLGTEKNSAILTYYQVGQVFDNRRKAIARVIETYLKEKTFDQLRTTEQLGYIVWTLRWSQREALGFLIMVQSNVANPNYLATRVEAHLQNMLTKIREISVEELDKYINSVRVDLQRAPLSIAEEGGRYWSEVDSHKYQFDRMEQMINELAKITKEEFIKLFEETFFTNRKLVEFHAIAQLHSKDNEKARRERTIVSWNPQSLSPIADLQLVNCGPNDFQRKMKVFPDGDAY